MGKRVLVACLLPLVLVTTAGCAKSPTGRDVASVNGSAAPSPTPSLSFEAQGRRHAQCMRAHGVPESDPQVQPNGSVRVGGGYDKQSLDPDVVDAAILACRPYEPVLAGPDRDLKTQGALEYARCMRAHGVENFPDPDANGRFALPTEQSDPDYDAARATCRTPVASTRPSP